VFLILFIFSSDGFSQSNDFAVIAYYSGRPTQVDSFPIEKLTHIIFSFSHLKGNELHINNKRDTATIQELVSLKRRNPNLKVLLSLGGWGGCVSCSDIFSSRKDRRYFARSVERLSAYFGTDGIDLDWEYPAIEGFPGHTYKPEDKENFTALVKKLRRTLGKKYEISFAAGGFKQFIDHSIEWKKVMKEVNFVNLMTYDLVNGFDTTTGNHTPLFSTPHQMESTDHAVTQLIGLGVPVKKIIIGAAFYGRIWENVANTNFGMYQNGRYKHNVIFRDLDSLMIRDSGFVNYWDSIAQAPYLYNASQKLFMTYDDKKSMQLKTRYLVDKGLGGIMFWELAYDRYTDGLLDVIDKVKKNYKGKY
jgi:chitinase